MKLQKNCITCLIEVATKQAELATGDRELQLKALKKFTKYLGTKISPDAVPAYIGSERNKIIKEVTSNQDPFKELKKDSNKAGQKLKPIVEKLVDKPENDKEKLRNALKAAAVGNSMEFGVSGHNFDPDNFQREFEELFEKDLTLDNSNEIISKILSGEEVLYLADNCGEIIIDQILMKKIKDTGTDLSIGVKSGPTQEDVTLEIAKDLGIDEFGDLIPMGSLIGIYSEESPQEILDKIESADLIISKGMGNFEAISEFESDLKGRLAYLLRAKCVPVAESLGVKRGELVIKFLN